MLRGEEQEEKAARGKTSAPLYGMRIPLELQGQDGTGAWDILALQLISVSDPGCFWPSSSSLGSPAHSPHLHP